MSGGNAAAPEEKSSGGSSSGGKLPVILAIVNLVATFGMVAILFLSFKKDSQKPSVEDIAAHPAEGEHGGGAHGGGHGEGEHGGGGEHGKEAKAEGHGGGEHGGGEHGGGGHGGGHGDAAKKKSSEYGKMLTLDQFTVNLSTPGNLNPKFVRVNISLEVATEDTETEVTSKMPQVRNAIIDLFNSKRPSDLETVERRDYLKEEIKAALNAFLKSGKIAGVFFTSFALSG